MIIQRAQITPNMAVMCVLITTPQILVILSFCVAISLTDWPGITNEPARVQVFCLYLLH